jgi:hypothetical protein
MCAFVDAVPWANVTVFLRRVSPHAAFRALVASPLSRDLIVGTEY